MRVGIAHESLYDTVYTVQEYTDLDFTISHFALARPTYAEAYAKRPQGRVLILDNGKFELQKAQEDEKVLEAADAVKANYVISPDTFGDVKQTLRALERFLPKANSFEVAAVVVGQTPEEQIECYNAYRKIDEIGMYCWSFLYPRAEALAQVVLDSTKPHHLLGFGTCRELKETLKPFYRDNLGVTLDTMKPLSAAYAKERLVDRGRGGYKRPFLGDMLSSVELLVLNMGIFRGWVAGIVDELARQVCGVCKEQ